MKPFLLIAGLFRSGTTLAQELLTEKGKGFIFHEPRFMDLGWQFEQWDRKYLSEVWGLNPPKLNSPAETWAYFMEDQGLQIGVKEIRNQASMGYYNAWGGNMRLLLIDRSADEIYISCYKMLMRNSQAFTWRPRYLPFSPINLFREVQPEITALNELYHWLHDKCRLVVPYEYLIDECRRPSIYRFCESNITEPEIGKYHAILPRGQYETKLHGSQVTGLASSRGEVPDNIRRDADKFNNLVLGVKTWT